MNKQLKSNDKAGLWRRCKLVTLLLLFTSSVTAFATDLVWDKTPIPLDLEVGEERLVHFPQSVSIGVPANLRKLVKVQSVGSTVYFTALQPFERQRLLARSRVDGSMIVLDVAGVSETVVPKSVHIRRGNASNQELNKLDFAALTRFAAQHAYAPARLVSRPKGLTPTPTPKSARGLLRGLPVRVKPYASWRTSGGLHLTSVVVINDSDEPIELHPENLRGNWLTATFHHYRLLSSDSGADRTVVYLISQSKFSQALGF